MLPEWGAGLSAKQESVSMRTLHALAVILTALALVPSGAHIAELPNKLSLDRDQYFVVQQVYRGWALFGVVIIAALVANLIFAILCWRRRKPFRLPLIAGLAIAASLVVFFLWVYPGNVATDNWANIPANWQELRTRWEFGHAAGAALVFIALCSAAFARGYSR
jgi:hypothetical protein